MKNKKMLSVLLSAAISASAVPFAVTAETTVSVLPQNTAKNVSVIDDIVLTGVTDTTNITVEGTSVPYSIVKTESGSKIIFEDALEYASEITVKNGDEVLTQFTTEHNPITTLFFEDFESTAALDRFENVGVNKLNLYEIYDGKLLMKTHATRQADGGTPVLRESKNNDILYIKGSENWDEYVVDIDVSDGWYTKADETGEYTDCEAMISVNTNRNDGSGMLLLQSYAEGWRSFSSYHLSDWAKGGYLDDTVRFNTNYKTVHHIKIDASTTDYTASITNDLDGTKSHTVGWGNGAHPSGGVSLRSSWGRIVFDNLLVTDKKLVFTTSDLKNVEDEVTLTFEKAVSSTDKITVSDENGISVNVPKSLSADRKVVTLNTAKLEELKKYTVTVASDFAAADGTVIANEKKFDFRKTSTFGVSETNVKNNFSIIDDIEITFTDAINQETAQSITVTGNNLPAYDVVTSEKGAKVVFAEGLPYNTEITLTIPAALQRADGIVMGKEQTYTFKTEYNPITTLFFEDFESAAALERFENVGVNKSVLYEIYDGKLLMKTHATRQADGGTPRLTTSKDNNILYITGSENWDEYVVDIDVSNGWYTKADETGEYTDSEAMISVNTNKNDGSGMLLLQCYDAGWRSFSSYHLSDWVKGGYLDDTVRFNTNYKTVHHIKIDASTTDYTASITNDLDGTKTHKVGWGNGAHPSGGVSLRSSWGRIVFDNLLVTDKGLTFGVEQSKYTDGEIKLVFDEALTNSEAELQNLVTVKNQNGETKELRVEYGQNQQSVLIEVLNAAEGEIYEITVDKAAKSAAFAKGMNNSKSFNLIYNPPYSIRNLAINEKDGQFVASAEINVTDKNIENQFTLILVVYDSEGKMVDFKTDAKTYDENTVKTFETQGIAKEAGYTASAFVWDNINDMTPLSGKVTK